MSKRVFRHGIGAKVGQEDGGIVFDVVGGRAKIERCSVSIGCISVNEA